jgi:hypothetical protein
MDAPNPKAFVCMRGNKARFVSPFSTAFRANGVEAWFLFMLYFDRFPKIAVWLNQPILGCRDETQPQ